MAATNHNNTLLPSTLNISNISFNEPSSPINETKNPQTHLNFVHHNNMGAAASPNKQVNQLQLEEVKNERKPSLVNIS